MTRNKITYLSLSVLSFIVIILIWSMLSLGGFVKAIFLPSPWTVFQSLISLFVEHNFIHDLGISVFRIFTGFLIAVLIGVPVGIIIGLNKKARALLGPSVDFIRYIPFSAVIPLFILWFGIGDLEKIMIIAGSVFAQLAILVAISIATTPKEIVESAKTLGATPWQLFYKTIYPFAKPRILDDIRISAAWAWSGLLIAEIVGSTSGIGYIIIQSQRLLQTGFVIAAILTVGILGIITDLIFRYFHNLYFPWAKGK